MSGVTPVVGICGVGRHDMCFGYGWKFKSGHEDETPRADNTERGGPCGCWCHMAAET